MPWFDKEKKQTYLIDTACVMNRNVIDKEKEKIDKYLNLMIELQHLWDTAIDIVPIVFGAFGSLYCR